MTSSAARRKKTRNLRKTELERSIPKADRRLGVVKLTPKQQDLKAARNNISVSVRVNAVPVFMDVENFIRELPKGFNLNNMKNMILAFLQGIDPNYFVYGKLVGVGNMSKCFGGLSRFTSWKGVTVYDIYPRDAFCSNPKCKEQLQYASSYMRSQVANERVTDIADRLLQFFMFKHAREFGGSCKMLLITGDGDFTRAVKLLKMCNVEVLLITPTNFSKELKNEACKSFPLSSIFSS